MYGNCKCFHHILAKILVALAWLSALLFWWTSWKVTMVWAMDSNSWFQSVVVFSLLVFGTHVCGCCKKHGMGEVNKGGYCAACEGKGGEHNH